jgi:hypothetical protein
MTRKPADQSAKDTRTVRYMSGAPGYLSVARRSRDDRARLAVAIVAGSSSSNTEPLPIVLRT